MLAGQPQRAAAPAGDAGSPFSMPAVDPPKSKRASRRAGISQIAREVFVGGRLLPGLSVRESSECKFSSQHR